MRSAERVRRAVSATVAGGLCAILPALVAPDRVYAAPVCSAPPAAAESDAELPWAQRRHGLERLAGLADGASVLVAVVDSGVDPTHPQLAGAVVAGLDLLDDGGDGRLDCVGHGTAVASIIAGRARAGTALRGVAPGATVLPVRVSERIDDEADGRAAPLADVASAVRRAVDRGARVVNLSLTTDRDDPALRDAVRYARSRDVVLVAAAGNRHEAGNPRPYPASYDGVVGVGGVQPDGVRVPTSQTGPHVDLAAPGADITAAARGGGHARYAGTSFAAAFVAGTAALVRQYHPALTADQVTERLITTADALDPGSGTGAGVVNPYRAVTASLDGTPRVAAGPVARQTPDAAARRAAATAADTRRTAYRLALAGAGAAALLLLMASARRHSRARRRPARPTN
jgi:type VII secretion-associated serine protease mycosin